MAHISIQGSLRGLLGYIGVRVDRVKGFGFGAGIRSL